MLIRLPLWHTRCVRSGLPMNKGIFWLVAIFLVVTAAIAEAQQPKKVPRIGLLVPSSATSVSTRRDAFLQGLRDLGYVEGKNIAIEYRYTEGQLDRIPDLAAELVRLNVDVIVTSAISSVRAAKKATATITIVFASVGDAVDSGFGFQSGKTGWKHHWLDVLCPGVRREKAGAT